MFAEPAACPKPAQLDRWADRERPEPVRATRPDIRSQERKEQEAFPSEGTHLTGTCLSWNRGREGRLNTRPPLLPNRACGSPAHGSPVGGSPPSGLTRPLSGELRGKLPESSEEDAKNRASSVTWIAKLPARDQHSPQVPPDSDNLPETSVSAMLSPSSGHS